MRTCLVALALALFSTLAAADDKVGVRVSQHNSPDGAEIAGKEVTATASSTLCESKPKLCHGPERLVDDDTATAWCEGMPGDGEGAVLTFVFARPQPLVGIGIIPHFARSFALAEANGALQTIEIATDGLTITAELEDLVDEVARRNGVKPITRDCGDESCLSRDRRIQLGVRQYISFGRQPKNPDDFFQAIPIKTSKVVITVKDIYPGTRYHDTCASAITFYRAR